MTEKKTFNIAIDGPAGAGKSTIAKAVAKKLGFVYVDTGAMYRTLALYFLRNKIPVDNEAAVSEACSRADVTIRYMNGEQQVLLNGEDVSGLIRTEEVGNAASVTSVYPAVRAHLLELQRGLAKAENVIMDGRDIGTCILPRADVKIFLTAGADVRAKRRFLELKEKQIACNLEEIEQDIIERDNRDKNRSISPLRQAEDAVLVDSSGMSVDEVIGSIIDIAAKHGLKV